MKKIGTGWQYNVYAISDTRVFKREIPKWVRVVRVFVESFGNIREIAEIKKRLDDSVRILKRIISRNDFDPTPFGNIRFIEGSSFEQDRAVPISKYFREHSFEENKKVIDSFIGLIFKSWQQGISERTFSLMINDGVIDGRVILLDIGELTDSKSEVANAIKIKKWLKSRSYWNGLLWYAQLRNYYRDRMEQSMTLENLEKYWKQK